ncbi:MAG: hypothetical protein ACYC6Y_14980 [Thermoguttaceae bacterium]
MDDRREWTVEQLEALETFRSKDDANGIAELRRMAEVLAGDDELSARLDRVLDWDARLVEAMRDVPVPPGLAEHILQAVEDRSRPAAVVAQAGLPVRGRRRLLWAAVAVGTGVAAAVMAILLGGSPGIDPDRLRTLAFERFVAEEENGPAVPKAATQSFPERFPYSPELFPVPGTRWRHVAHFDGAEAVTYEIPLGNGQKASLYVVRCRSKALPTSVPRVPQQMQTRGLALSAWQGDGVAYVLVVEGGEPAYRALVKARSHGLT